MGEGDLEQWLTTTGRAGAVACCRWPCTCLSVDRGGRAKNPECTSARRNLPDCTRDFAKRLSAAQASRIEVEIRYDDREFRLRVRDDGKGVDSRVLEGGGTAGHWGVRGVRERAQQIGARLDFWSEAGAGTEVELTVPAAIAYEKAMERRRFSLLRKA